MKQRLSLEQLRQLTLEQRERLQELWEPQDGDWIAQLEYDYVLLIEQGSLEVSSVSTIRHQFLPLLTLGQMIELFQVLNPVEEEVTTEYRISWREHEELIDRLWESLKQIL